MRPTIRRSWPSSSGPLPGKAVRRPRIASALAPPASAAAAAAAQIGLAISAARSPTSSKLAFLLDRARCSSSLAGLLVVGRAELGRHAMDLAQRLQDALDRELTEELRDASVRVASCISGPSPFSVYRRRSPRPRCARFPAGCHIRSEQPAGLADLGRHVVEHAHVVHQVELAVELRREPFVLLPLQWR
jgi:hypothetical protein